jgi:hypothetical protein
MIHLVKWQGGGGWCSKGEKRWQQNKEELTKRKDCATKKLLTSVVTKSNYIERKISKKNTLLDHKSSSVMLSRCGRHTVTRPRRRSLAVEAFSFMISDRYRSLARSRSLSPSVVVTLSPEAAAALLLPGPLGALFW